MFARIVLVCQKVLHIAGCWTRINSLIMIQIQSDIGWTPRYLRRHFAKGNHAGALALAAKERGIKCFVVMVRCHVPQASKFESIHTHVQLPHCTIEPSNSSQPKIDAVRSYGAEITFCEPNAPARAAMLATVQQRTGATFIPPYDAVNTILGQGTALLELLEQTSEPLAAVVVPVGGGGLLAGTALAAEGTGVRVFGAEPAGADDCAQGLKEGKRREFVDADTIADGLRTPVGQINFPIIQEKVEKVIVVSDEVRDFLFPLRSTPHTSRRVLRVTRRGHIA